MKLTRLLPILLIAGAALAATAQNAEIKACYDKLRKCMMSKDVKGMFALCAPDMTWTEGGKTMKQADLRGEIEAQMKATQKYDELTFKLSKVTMKGATAVVDCDNVVKATILIQGAKKPSKIVSISTSVDTWVKGKSGWTIKSVVVKKSSTTVDGKPVNMGG